MLSGLTTLTWFSPLHRCYFFCLCFLLLLSVQGVSKTLNRNSISRKVSIDGLFPIGQLKIFARSWSNILDTLLSLIDILILFNSNYCYCYCSLAWLPASRLSFSSSARLGRGYWLLGRLRRHLRAPRLGRLLRRHGRSFPALRLELLGMGLGNFIFWVGLGRLAASF